MFDQDASLLGRHDNIPSTVLQRWEALDRGWKAGLFGILIVLPHLAGVLP